MISFIWNGINVPRETLLTHTAWYCLSMGKDNIYKVSSEGEIQIFLSEYQDWVFEEDRLKASFKLGDFETAIAVINKVAEVAKQMDHHPRIVNTYTQLEFSLCTHSAGDKVTSYDFALAKEISAIIASYK